jgi:hypothetical protein
MPEKYQRPHSHERVQAVERMQRAWAAEREALLIVRNFNVRLLASKSAGFWPTVSTAITAKHPWLVIACDSCGTVTDLDLRMRPRDPEASVALSAGPNSKTIL